MFSKTTLKNGLRIITVPQKSSQAVTVMVLVATGSKNETKEINGISHFLEHMMFKGTKKRPTPLAVAETLDKVGGLYNAFTGQDFTGYYAKVETSQFKLAFDWVSDIFLNSLLPEKEIKKEKGVIIEEVNMIYDHPMSYLAEVLWPKLLYGNQPAGWDIAGTKETVLAITKEKLRRYRENQYLLENTVLSVAGNVSHGPVVQLAQKYFTGAKSEKPVYKPKVVERQIDPQCLLEYRQTDQSHINLGVRSYNIFHPQRYAQDVLGIILGGMMSSRLFVEIRERLGLAYYIRTEVEDNPDTGFLVTRAGVDNKRAEKAVSTIIKEYRKLSQIRVSGEELKKAKDNLKGRLALLLESSDARASFYANQELFEKKISTLKEVFKSIDKVSANDILKVAKDIFQPKNLNLALIGPFKDKTKFEKLINKNSYGR
ncbi:MAG: pitrilysin family protein [bacterium]